MSSIFKLLTNNKGQTVVTPNKVTDLIVRRLRVFVPSARTLALLLSRGTISARFAHVPVISGASAHRHHVVQLLRLWVLRSTLLYVSKAQNIVLRDGLNSTF